MRIAVKFDAQGNLQYIRCREVAFLESLGQARHDRMSHIVPVNRVLRWLFVQLRSHCRDTGWLAAFTRRWPCRWQADLALCGGPVLGPFTRRADALAAEVAWIETHILGAGSRTLITAQLVA